MKRIAVAGACALVVGVAFCAGRATAPVRTLPPTTVASATAPAAAPASVVVWVNTRSGVYHVAGDRWYGATQAGKYMDETAARAAGYRAAIVY